VLADPFKNTTVITPVQPHSGQVMSRRMVDDARPALAG
jgi:hypothetical protein